MDQQRSTNRAPVSFEWLPFVQQRNIEFVRKGKNVSGNHIAIKCPLCGSSDPSQHMVLSLDKKAPYWYCWRDTTHRGRNPTFLIAKLTGLSLTAARALVEEGPGVLDDEWASVVKRLVTGTVTTKENKVTAIEVPKQVQRLRDKVTNRLFIDYLERRGFNRPEQVIRDVELYCAFNGWFAYRLIFPIYHEGKLVNLVGRDISGKSEKRYKNMPVAESGLPLERTVYNHDEALLGGQVLWVFEGPIDALKMWLYGDHEDSCVAMFGMPKNAQLALISRLGQWFDYVGITLDQGAMGNALRLRDQLACPVANMWLPDGTKDVGAMTPKQVISFAHSAKERLTTKTIAPRSDASRARGHPDTR